MPKTYKPSRQQEIILSHLRGGQWVCGSVWLNQIKDDRARISSLNDTYMKEKGYVIIGQKCDGRCGKRHSSGLFMRKAVKIGSEEAAEHLFREYNYYEKRKNIQRV